MKMMTMTAIFEGEVPLQGLFCVRFAQVMNYRKEVSYGQYLRRCEGIQSGPYS